MPSSSDCPCGSGRALAECCGAIIDGGVIASTAEALMRSRYTAYALGRALYLHESWHPRTRPASIDLDDGPTWLGLSIVDASEEGDRAIVEFKARYREHGAVRTLHERSRFERRRGRWVYVDGDLL